MNKVIETPLSYFELPVYDVFLPLLQTSLKVLTNLISEDLVGVFCHPPPTAVSIIAGWGAAAVRNLISLVEVIYTDPGDRVITRRNRKPGAWEIL